MNRFVRAVLSGTAWGVTGKRFVLSIAIGLIAGLGAIAFQFLCHFVLEYGLAGISGFVPSMPAGEPALNVSHDDSGFVPWLLVAVMVGGGLVSGWLV